MPNPGRAILAASAAAIVALAVIPLYAQTGGRLLEGTAAFGDWRTDSPGTRRLIRPQDLPAPDMAESVRNAVRVVRRTDDEKPIVPNGFEVNLFASGLDAPRIIRVAPNGDVFAAESAAGRIKVLRPNGNSAAAPTVFASGQFGAFGIAFYPPGPDPQWVYVGNTDAVVRFPYRNGDLTARGPAEVIVPHLPVGGHKTRDVAFSPDGGTMYVSVGSASNIAEGMEKLAPAQAQKW
jgi:glucose/arabinose dehydrogenase